MKPEDLKKYAEYFREYTELRWQENRNSGVTMVNGNMIRNNQTSLNGISARVYKDGKWGFASDPDFEAVNVKAVIATATENAVFLGKKGKADGGDLPGTQTEITNDFSTTRKRRSRKEIIEFIQNIDAHIIKHYPDLKSRTISLGCLDMEKSLINATGSLGYSMIPRSILYVVMSIEKDGKPIELYDTYGGFGQLEDNFLDLNDLYEKLEVQYRYLKDKGNGVYPVSGYHDCILDSDLAGILAHEAIGHTTEADIVMGGSIAADFMDREIASSQVTMIDFANHALGNLCPVPVFIDDEGTKAEDVVLIRDGILKSYMHNKETARHFKVKPTGNARAYGFYDEPLIRMRNTAIIPGKDSLQDMISSIEDGYYLMKSSNGQADSTSEFMFGIVQGYEIKKGKLGRAILDTSISGVAFDMLKTITMISDDMSWSCSGMCGKKQSIPVGMGGPAIKCKISIGGK